MANVEKAIRILEGNYKSFVLRHNGELLTVNELIALLKAQEPNEDWISRKLLKDEIQYYIDEAGWGDEVNKVLGWCMEFIDNQRAVKWDE